MSNDLIEVAVDRLASHGMPELARAVHDALEAKDQRIAELETVTKDMTKIHNESDLKRIEQLEAALRIFDPGMNSLDHLGERDGD